MFDIKSAVEEGSKPTCRLIVANPRAAAMIIFFTIAREQLGSATR
jgi:hypothetical protein